MRALFVLLIAGLVAFGAVLVGCDGGDDQQQQGQQAQETGEAEQSAQSGQAAGSDRATAVQREESAGQSAAQQAVQQEQPQQDPPVTTTTVEGPITQATAAFEAWAEDLESLVLETNVDFNLGGLASEIDTTIVAQLDPFNVWATIDASSLFAQAALMADDDSDQATEPLIMQILISADAAFVLMPQVDGWIDLTDDFDETQDGLTAMLGGNPEDFANPDHLGQALSCVEEVGGSISEGSHAGEPVWFAICEIDVESLDNATVDLLMESGIEIADTGIETMHMTLVLSQNSGAPLLVETHATLQDAFGFSDSSEGSNEQSDEDDAPQFYVSTVTTLVSWNEPVEFPTPEPLIDGSFLEALGDSAPSSGSSSGSDQGSSSEPPELLNTEELLGIATEWVAAADELNTQFVAQAVIDGEARLASTIVRGSRTQGAFETLVNIDDASTFRLLWNRDGIWISDSEVDGQPVWAPSNPALLGFAGLTVDEFLANPDRLNLEPLKALLNLSWLTRTIEGNRPPVYELVIETGYLTPEDPHFEAIVAILKAETAELLAESVIVESIDHYSTILTVSGDLGQVTSQITTAEFQSNAGRVELAASLNIVSNGPIEFSTPTK